MKQLLLTLMLFGTFQMVFSQTIVATTENGKKVILNNDKTWEYAPETESINTCVIEKGFKEPKWNKSGTWKRIGTRVDDLKKHISVDLGVNEKDIILLQLSEQLGNAVYILCINGTKTKYRRTGSVFRKEGEDALKMD